MVHVALRAGTYVLPYGGIAVTFDEASLQWAGRRLTDLVAVAELKVRGLKTRYRQSGIGAQLAATPVTVQGDAYADDFLSSDAKVAVTTFLRLEHPRQQLTGSRLYGSLEAFLPQTTASSAENTVAVGDRRIPLEIETTATIAYALAESTIWKQEISHFFDNLGAKGAQRAALNLEGPYRPERIPVVLVHGTASSSGRWAELLNRLVNDPRIRQRYQFWSFTYETGNPIGYSAMLLRDALRNVVARLDPDGQDPELFRAHSIIAVKSGGPVQEGDDGVVKYTSAHIDGVESELVVRSDHSVQWAAEAIEEVRRILLLHAADGGHK